MSPQYETLGSTDRISDSREDLNGVTTRLEWPAWMDFSITTAPITTNRPPVTTWAWASGGTHDRVVLWWFPKRLDRTVDATILLYGFMNASIGGDNIQMDVDCYDLTVDADVTTGTPTFAIDSGDVPANDTLEELFAIPVIIPAAELAAPRVGLVLDVKRGTASVDEIATGFFMFKDRSLSIEYAITR